VTDCPDCGGTPCDADCPSLTAALVEQAEDEWAGERERCECHTYTPCHYCRKAPA
jgi:hypothetical protein